jgi:hypothetical protein
MSGSTTAARSLDHATKVASKAVGLLQVIRQTEERRWSHCRVDRAGIGSRQVLQGSASPICHEIKVHKACLKHGSGTAVIGRCQCRVVPVFIPINLIALGSVRSSPPVAIELGPEALGIRGFSACQFNAKAVTEIFRSIRKRRSGSRLPESWRALEVGLFTNASWRLMASRSRHTSSYWRLSSRTVGVCFAWLSVMPPFIGLTHEPAMNAVA